MESREHLGAMVIQQRKKFKIKEKCFRVRVTTHCERLPRDFM